MYVYLVAFKLHLYMLIIIYIYISQLLYINIYILIIISCIYTNYHYIPPLRNTIIHVKSASTVPRLPPMRKPVIRIFDSISNTDNFSYLNTQHRFCLGVLAGSAAS